MRHGDAPFDNVSGERVLSPQGAKDTAKVVTARAKELTRLTHIICSPSRRARQTLSVLQKTVKTSAELIFNDCLRSESSVPRVEKFIDSMTVKGPMNVLLVTHQPLIGSIYRYLLDQPQDPTFLSTSNLACFELVTFARGCAELRWLDSP